MYKELAHLCIAGSKSSVIVLEESPCLQGSFTSLVLVLGGLSTKSSKSIVEDYVFHKQKQSVMYDHVKSVNSVTANVYEVTVKECLTHIRCYLLISVSKTFFTVT